MTRRKIIYPAEFFDRDNYTEKETNTMTDRMSAALTAISLIEQPKHDDIDALLPNELTESLTVLSSTVWCAHALASQLALHLSVDRAAILTELRNAIIDAFKADPDNEIGNDK